MYVGFSNDTITYKKGVDEFIEKAESLTKIQCDEMENVSETHIQ